MSNRSRRGEGGGGFIFFMIFVVCSSYLWYPTLLIIREGLAQEAKHAEQMTDIVAADLCGSVTDATWRRADWAIPSFNACRNSVAWMVNLKVRPCTVAHEPFVCETKGMSVKVSDLFGAYLFTVPVTEVAAKGIVLL